MRRVECLSGIHVPPDERRWLAINVWRDDDCKGVDIVDDRHRPEFAERVLTPAVAALNARLWPDVAPVTLEEVCFDG